MCTISKIVLMFMLLILLESEIKCYVCQEGSCFMRKPGKKEKCLPNVRSCQKFIGSK